MTLQTALIIGFIGLGLIALVAIGRILVVIGRIWEESEANESPWEYEQTQAEADDLAERLSQMMAVSEQAKVQ